MLRSFTATGYVASCIELTKTLPVQLSLELLASQLFYPSGRWCAAGCVTCMQAYVRQQAQLLVELQDGRKSDGSSLAELQRCSVEMIAFVFCYSIGSPDGMGKLFSINMQDGSSFIKPVPVEISQELLVCMSIAFSVTIAQDAQPC